jgi:hypothetical protein
LEKYGTPVAESQSAAVIGAVNSDKCKKFLRLCSVLAASTGVALLAAYFVRCWPYVHREEFRLTVLSSDGSDFVASGYIPLPFTPWLLIGIGAVLWLGSVFAVKR